VEGDPLTNGYGAKKSVRRKIKAGKKAKRGAKKTKRRKKK
jgi:hypothetical protein